MKKWKVVIDNPFKNCELIYPIQQKKVAEIVDFLKDNKYVKKIIIFGSSVTERCTINSDVDVYIELTKEMNVFKNKYFNFIYDLWTNFYLDKNEKLYKEIMEKGVVVYEKINNREDMEMANFYDESIKIDLSQYKSKSSLKYLEQIIEELEKFDKENDYSSFSNYVGGLESELKSLLLVNKIDEDLYKILMKKYGGEI